MELLVGVDGHQHDAAVRVDLVTVTEPGGGGLNRPGRVGKMPPRLGLGDLRLRDMMDIMDMRDLRISDMCGPPDFQVV